MKEIYKEFKNVFNEYGAICLGIAMLILVLWCTGWLITCSVIGLIMWALGFSFSWLVGTIVWLILIILFKISRKRLRKNSSYTD